jgi:cobalt-zinc-cadmium efflux system outer membrane protein
VQAALHTFRKLTLGTSLLAAWPSLDQVASRARDYAPGVVEASGAVGTARSVGIGARLSSFGNPYIEVIADRGHHTTDVQALGTMWIPVDVNGQRSARIGEADRLLEWRQLSRSEMQSRAMAEAVLAYGDGLVASGHLANALAQEAEARSEATWFTAKAEARDATIVDVSMAISEVSRYVQARAEAQLRLHDARLRLVILTGTQDLDPSPPTGTRPDPPALRVTLGAASRVASQGEVPALRANQAEAGFWSAMRERAETDKNAPFLLVLYGGRGDFGEARMGGGLGYTFPIARRNQGEVARAQAERTRALQMRSTLQRSVVARLQSAYASLQTALEAVTEMDATGIPAAQTAVKATLDSFREGKTELVRVIIARRDLATVRARRLDLVSAAWRSYAEMVSILGTLP